MYSICCPLFLRDQNEELCRICFVQVDWSHWDFHVAAYRTPETCRFWAAQETLKSHHIFWLHTTLEKLMMLVPVMGLFFRRVWICPFCRNTFFVAEEVRKWILILCPKNRYKFVPIIDIFLMFQWLFPTCVFSTSPKSLQRFGLMGQCSLSGTSL